MRKDINYNKQIKNLKLYNGYFVKKPVFYLIFLPFILLFIASLCYKICLTKAPNLFKRLKTSRSAQIQKLIGKAEAELSNDNFEASRDLIYKALIEIINLKTGVEADNLQKDRIVDNLRKKNIDDEKIADIIKTLDRLNFYKFTLVNLDKNSTVDLINAVKKIEKTIICRI
jgi:hypothetical protein